MPNDSTPSHRNRAIRLRTDGELVRAGEYYSLAGFARLSDDVPGRYGIRVSGGVVNLLRAAICYRVGDRMDRCRNRCRMGILVAEDMHDRVFDAEQPENSYDRARRGVWQEYIGDFRCIGDIGDPDAAYENAIDVYEHAGDPDTFYSEQEHCYTMAVYHEVTKAVDRDSGPIDDYLNDMTFTDWVRKKQETYPLLLGELDQYDEWNV